MDVDYPFQEPTHSADLGDKRRSSSTGPDNPRRRTRRMSSTRGFPLGYRPYEIGSSTPLFPEAYVYKGISFDDVPRQEHRIPYIYNRSLRELVEWNLTFSFGDRPSSKALINVVKLKVSKFKYPKPDPLPDFFRGALETAEATEFEASHLRPDASDSSMPDPLLPNSRIASDEYNIKLIDRASGHERRHWNIKNRIVRNQEAWKAADVDQASNIYDITDPKISHNSFVMVRGAFREQRRRTNRLNSTRRQGPVRRKTRKTARRRIRRKRPTRRTRQPTTRSKKTVRRRLVEMTPRRDRRSQTTQRRRGNRAEEVAQAGTTFVEGRALHYQYHHYNITIYTTIIRACTKGRHTTRLPIAAIDAAATVSDTDCEGPVASTLLPVITNVMVPSTITYEPTSKPRQTPYFLSPTSHEPLHPPQPRSPSA